MRSYGFPVNRVTASNITGIFKGKQIEVIFNKTFKETKVLLDGKPIKDIVGIWIKCIPGKPTRLSIEIKK
jgi:hypothetical protein